tara:strand:- start:238 stop:3357 length:3120 start_codon:yes stop_codon:yes gene_type:complete
MEEVRKYKVLDTEPEEYFDQITAAAAELCGCEISLVSIVDSHRNWFKSRFGPIEGTEIPRDEGFCAYAIMDDDVFVVEDALLDERFSTNPQVVGGLKIRFYAGAPLITPSGHKLGALCVVGKNPGKLSAMQKQVLKQLSKQVVTQFELENKMQNHKAFQEIANIGSWHFDLGSQKITWSEQMYKIFPEDEKKGPPSLERHQSTIHPEDLDQWATVVGKCIENGKPYHLEFRVIHPDNHIVWVKAFGKANLTKDGKIYSLSGTCQDISLEKELELENQKLIFLSRKLQEVAMIGAWELDIETNELTCTEQVYSIHGVPTNTPLNRISGISFYAPHEQEKIAKYLDDCINKKQRYDDIFEFFDAKGKLKIVRAIGEPLLDKKGNLLRLVGTFQDVSEQMKIREDLEHTARELSRFFELSTNLFCIAGRDGFLKKINPIFSQVLGYTEEELFSKRFIDFVHPDDQKLTSLELEKFTKSKRTVSFRNRIICKNGEEKHFIWGLSYDQYSGLLYASGHEISSLIELQKTVETQRIFLKNTLDNMPAIIYAKDLEGNFLTVNDGFRRLIGKSDEEIIGKSHYEIFPREVADQFRKNDLDVEKARKIIESEENAFDDTGREHFYHSFKFPYFDKDGKVVAVGGVSLDITEKKLLEKQAFHNSKLASIGEMAAGIGHEINNPLAIIKGYMGFLQKNINMPENINVEEAKKSLEKIDIAADRIAKIVRGLRTFSRSDDDAKSVFNMEEAVSESFGMVREIYEREGILVEYNHVDPTGGGFNVYGNRGRVQQVLMNLLSNAKDATKGRPDARIGISLKHCNGRVCIDFEDNGSGIPEKIIDRIFDPFFTTKEVNNGTGIGLSLVHNVIQEHGGTIKVTSTPGKGTKFEIVFPAEKVAVKADAAPLDEVVPGIDISGVRALLVDDEPGIRDLVQSILEETGVTVTCCENGLEAMEKYLAHPEDFDVVISDMKMPVMDGPSLIKNLRAKSATLPKFILMTGGVNINFEDQHSELSNMVDGYFFKPFDSDLINETLNKVVKGENSDSQKQAS